MIPQLTCTWESSTLQTLESEYGNYLEDMITDNTEDICEQPEEDVKPTESHTPTHAIEVPDVVASLTPS